MSAEWYFGIGIMIWLACLIGATEEGKDPIALLLPIIVPIWPIVVVIHLLAGLVLYLSDKYGE